MDSLLEEVSADSGIVPLMTVKLSQDSFVALLSKSGLVAEQTLKPLIAEFEASEPGGADEGERLAQFLIRKGELTTWQAKKLLQGKHKGFTLGKYKLMSLLGRGGMSSVYLAEHVVMRRRCAIKVLPSKQVKDTAALTRFHQEAQAVAALDDPNIVRAYDVDHVRDGSNEIHFLVMEYVEGRSLQEVVDQDGPLSLPDVVDFICQAASGLDHAHAAGMVHRDIKPSNLLLDLHGTVKILDLGLARFFEQTDQQSLTIQHDQRVLGTADYLSPEQAVDSHNVDTRSDIYSLGGTLYYLLAGHPPFPEGTLAQRLLAHQTRQPKAITEIRPDVPASFARILERMMAKKRDDRQSTVGQVREELQAWLQQHGEAFAEEQRPTNNKNPRQSPPSAEPTTAGWSDLAPEGFTPPSDSDLAADSSHGQPADSHVVSDPGLGEFLSGLSSEGDPAAKNSDRMTSDKTVVSTTDPVPVAPLDTDAWKDSSGSNVVSDSGLQIGASGSHPYDSKSLSGSHLRRKKKPPLPMPLLIGGAAAMLLVIGAILFWPSSEAPPSDPATSNDTGTSADPATVASSNGEMPEASNGPSRPAVEPGADVTVGPEGNFATIGEAIEYVRENFQPLSATEERTIRVAGGQTYAESIQIDNSQFGAFPQGVRIVCEDAQQAVLAPSGSDPVVTLLNVERFHLQGFELAGGGRPVAMMLDGYLVNSTFEQLTIDNVRTAAIQTSGIAGFAGRQVTFRDVLIHKLDPNALGILLAAGDRTTKELLIDQCRFGGKMAAGIRIDGDASNIAISRCRFNEAATGVQFVGSSQSLENISLTNNTFRGFSRAVTFAFAPSIGSRGVGFQKNLFAGGSGLEVVVESGGSSLQAGNLVKGLGARFNWSDGAGAGELPVGAIDIFQNGGQRGASLEFASTDVANAEAFLKPESAELRTAAREAPNPKFIGAVAPGNGP